MSVRRQSRQAGFTLVEMLVVIIIIGILAGLLIPAIGAARRRVIDGRIAIEINNVAQAVEAYKQKHGDYPPNCTDLARLKKHILMAWPHIHNNELTAVKALLEQNLDPAEAIPFWLGGFSSDPKFPFTGPGGPLVLSGDEFFANPDRVQGLYEFDKGRLSLGPAQQIEPDVIGQRSTDDIDGDSFPVYSPKGSEMPLVYFDSRSYDDGVFYPPNPNDNTGAAKPYLSERKNPASPLGHEWVNENTFQIISAGRDNHYGSYACVSDPAKHPVFPTDEYQNYDPTLPPSPPVFGFPGVGGDNDNITNFSEGGTLEDAKP